jgi:NAD(P)-dependent dehydrogenase (short-subunit alcohol dehydrogenase family)
LDETKALALDSAPSGTRVTTFVADVSDETQLLAFRDAVVKDHTTTSINLLFNNAGVAGAGSFVDDDRAAWERTFAIDWGGVYLGTRTFLGMLVAADEGHIVNTSSINGIFASVGPNRPHTSYSAAKFAVRGFSEALITDLRMHAPHVRVSVVMPGHVGTSIVINSGIVHGKEPDTLDVEDLVKVRRQLAADGTPVDEVSDEDLRKGVAMFGEAFRDLAPLTAASAAQIILEGVRQNKWRILVGEDAVIVDQMVRDDPENAYELDFWDTLRSRGLFGGFG